MSSTSPEFRRYLFEKTVTVDQRIAKTVGRCVETFRRSPRMWQTEWWMDGVTIYDTAVAYNAPHITCSQLSTSVSAQRS